MTFRKSFYVFRFVEAAVFLSDGVYVATSIHLFIALSLLLALFVRDLQRSSGSAGSRRLVLHLLDTVDAIVDVIVETIATDVAVVSHDVIASSASLLDDQ